MLLEGGGRGEKGARVIEGRERWESGGLVVESCAEEHSVVKGERGRASDDHSKEREVRGQP